MSQKLITVIAGCYNEAGNITEFYERVTAAMQQLPQYDYEICCIDNCSTDSTRDEIRNICAQDSRFKAIFNVRNFGPTRSGMHLFYHSRGDAVIMLVADLQDPPELILELVRKWEEGFKVAFLVRSSTEEKGILPYFRRLFYFILGRISDVRQIPGATGAGLYDKEVVDLLRERNDPSPYLRGLICELGWPIATVPFEQPVRKRGASSYSFMQYFDTAILGIVNHSRIPLRIATIVGIFVSFLSFLVGLFYLFLKLIYWDAFQLGLAPIVIGMFFFIGILFFILGLIGEYIGLLVMHIVHRPTVIESERINFK